MTGEQIIDAMGVRFDPAAFPRSEASVNLHLTDVGEDHLIGIGRSAINHSAGKRSDAADVTVHLTRAQLMAALGEPDALDVEVEVDGDRQVLIDLLASLDVFTMPAIIEP